MINNNNTIIFISTKRASYGAKLYEGITNRGYEVAESVISGNNIIIRVFRKLTMKYMFPTWRIVCRDWIKRIENKENILIVHDMYSYPIIRILRNKLHYKGRIILYYMDPVMSAQAKDCNYVNYNEERTLFDFDIYSFEYNDCERYKFKYNSLFYFAEDTRSAEGIIEQDVFFIGKDKDRLKECIRAKNELEKCGLTVKMHICKVRGKASKYGKEINYDYKEELTYQELLENIKKSRAVLEISPNNQSALTLRVYEALSNHIKVITNNETIMRYSFYNPNNVFIMYKDNHKELKNFVKRKFDCKQNNEIEAMEFENWIKRF